MKYFRMSYEEVVFKRSYVNILLLNRSIPPVRLGEDKDNGVSDEKGRKKGGKKEKKKGNYKHESQLFDSLM